MAITSVAGRGGSAAFAQPARLNANTKKAIPRGVKCRLPAFRRSTAPQSSLVERSCLQVSASLRSAPLTKIVKLGNRVLRFTIKRDGWRTL